MQRSALRLTTCLLFLLAFAHAASAWGVKGHTWVDDNAIELLPEGELQDYMRAAFKDTSFYTLVPDFQLKDGESGKLEGPNHFLNIERLTDHGVDLAEIPTTREGASRLYTDLELGYWDVGWLPWRIQEIYLGLVNAFRAAPRDVNLYAGLLAHYAADATQPLHTTVHYDGRADRVEDGVKFRKGIHFDYEIIFLEDHNIEFRESSLALAQPSQRIDDPFEAAMDTILEANTHVDTLYDVADRHWGDGKYEAWEPELADFTRERLAAASHLVASLWLSAWIEAGRPDLAAE